MVVVTVIVVVVVVAVVPKLCKRRNLSRRGPFWKSIPVMATMARRPFANSEFSFLAGFWVQGAGFA